MGKKNVILFGVALLISCSSGTKQKETNSKCLKLLKNTKIRAPHGIKYYGIYSNNKKRSLDKKTYSIRIVQHKNNCQGLVLEYLGDANPKIWSFTNEFACHINKIQMNSHTGFTLPYSNQTPFDHKFNFNGHYNQRNHLVGQSHYGHPNPKLGIERQNIVLKAQKNLDHNMAGFDWETIELMKIKAKCR